MDLFDRLEASQRRIRLADADPALFADLDPRSLREAAAVAVVPHLHLEPGPWSGLEHAPPRTPALLVIEGLLLRSVVIGTHPRAEIIGPGDLIRPWPGQDTVSTVPYEVAWDAVRPVRMAVLDARFEAAVARWPALATAMLSRAMRRSQWLALQLAITEIRHMDERLLVLFWHLADRWGRVSPEGVVIPVPITHALLARVVGAQRPTVTTALRKLDGRGFLSRQRDRSWVLARHAPSRNGG